MRVMEGMNNVCWKRTLVRHSIRLSSITATKGHDGAKGQRYKPSITQTADVTDHEAVLNAPSASNMEDNGRGGAKEDEIADMKEKSKHRDLNDIEEERM